jgi:branched-subunit amino acid transport protein
MKILLLILAMAAVTYIPRAIPAVMIDKLRLGRRFERFLQLIPYAAMTALIVPGIVSVDKSHPYIGLIGGLAAILVSIWKPKLVLVILAAVAAVAAVMAAYLLI